jgi:hypothetical protein
MTNLRAYLFTVFIAILFTLLFYHQSIGLNLLLFELFLLPLIFWITPVKSFTANGKVLTAGIIVTAIFTLLHASSFVIIMNLSAMFLWIGWLLLPDGRSLVSFAALATGNLALAPVNAVSRLLDENGKHQRTRHRIRQIAYYILPLFVICFFLMVYATSNPYFARFLDNVLRYPFKWLDRLLNAINFDLAFVLFVGLLTGILVVFRKRKERIPTYDRNASDTLVRRHVPGKGRIFRMLALKNEYRAGIFLLIILNLLILLQNVLDIWFVWFHFEWNGQYLRQFVHEGTYLLIFSILISIGIVLWLYRGNLNFIPGNRLLKRLSYAWLLQNMILVISVAVRNGWYIYYFALAYKRIGVFIFLALTLIGLITVLIKVSRIKTPFYLLRINTMSVFVLLVLSSLVNWDVVIARYNFSRYQHAFVHLDWLCTLSDKALPYLDKPKYELQKIRQMRDARFSFDHRYMSADEYYEIIQQRKRDFVADFDKRGFLSFNFADYKAWKELTGSPSR